MVDLCNSEKVILDTFVYSIILNSYVFIQTLLKPIKCVTIYSSRQY